MTSRHLKKASSNQVKAAEKSEDLNNISDDFLEEIRSVQFAQRETLKVLRESYKVHSLELKMFFDQLKPPYEVDTKEKKLTIPLNSIEDFKKLSQDISIAAGSIVMSHRGLFLVLVSQWDAYFGAVLRWIYKARPEIIDSSARAISFSELKQFTSIESAREKIIEDEISVVLRDSHGDQFAYLEKKLDLPLTKIDIWPRFIEITQRRNLIAHANGIISPQYLSVCKKHAFEVQKDDILGKKLEIIPHYFNGACECLAELGFKLSQVLWRKIKPEDSERAETHLLDTTYEMIKAEQYQLAIRILEFAIKPPMKFLDARSRYVSIVNLALAYKWSKDENKCREIIDGEDWSAASNDFLLAIAVLKDDFKEAISLMKRIGSNGDVSRDSYQNWPLFKEFRKSPEFVKTYSGIFDSSIELKELSPEVSSALLVSNEISRLVDEKDKKRNNGQRVRKNPAKNLSKT